MKSSDDKRFVYEKNQLIEVICQLRFPTILSIEAKEPAEFQDTIRASFPKYIVQIEQLPPQNGVQQSVKNHTFISEDGMYKLCMTKGFISLSTMRYTCWEDFAAWLDEPLGHFISIYKPAYFERIGMRFVNGFSREKLGLTQYRWNDLLQPQYLGVLDSDEIDEAKVTKCSVDVDMQLDDKCSLKFHAGPGFIKHNVRTGNTIQSVQEKEVRFILDQDVFMAVNIKLKSSAEALDSIHEHADRIFSEAITDTLHNAMEPTYIV